MSAEKGWISDPPPSPCIPRHRSWASYAADKIARSGALVTEADLRARQHAMEKVRAEQEAENARLRALVKTFDRPPLRIAERYAAGRRGAGKSSQADWPVTFVIRSLRG